MNASVVEIGKSQCHLLTCHGNNRGFSSLVETVIWIAALRYEHATFYNQHQKMYNISRRLITYNKGLRRLLATSVWFLNELKQQGGSMPIQPWWTFVPWSEVVTEPKQSPCEKPQLNIVTKWPTAWLNNNKHSASTQLSSAPHLMVLRSSVHFWKSWVSVEGQLHL